jgi:hypothetical protein
MADIEQLPGKLVCRQCGQEWATDEHTTILLEALAEHAQTVHPAPDAAVPRIWLR